MIQVAGGIQELARARIMLSHIKNGAPRAISSALNRAIATAKADTVREIVKTYDIKSSEVRKVMYIRRASISILSAAIGTKGGPIPLIKFRVTPNKPGYQAEGTVLRASVKRSGGKPIPNAFISQVGSGNHIGVFQRVGPKRLPIKQLYGPAIPQMMKEENIEKTVMTRAGTNFSTRLDHEISYLLSKEG